MAEELEHDPTLSPAAEAIHMPEPSYLPVVLALGLVIFLLGVLMGKALAAIGLVVIVVVLIRWIGQARREMSELPLEHGR